MRVITSLLLAVALLSPSSLAQHLALSCRDHPAYRSDWTPPLIRSIEQLERPVMQENIVYNPRHVMHNYVPVSDPNSTIYHNLDLFYSGGTRSNDRLARLYLQRPARIYLFLGVSSRLFHIHHSERLSLPNWKGHGWAAHANPTELYEFGVFQKLGRVHMHQYVYVFSRQSGSDNSIVIPSSSWIQKHISARFRVFLNFQVRLSEANGRASPMPGYFQGSMVAPNQPCPSALHETWRVKMDDPHDPDTRGHYFQTWHPAWDPCFWCAYGHEHGSSPQHLMRYTPKYGYAAWKNNRESEADPGFKGFVFRVGVFNVFYMLHAQASTLRRVNEEYHTVQLVVKRADTGALMLDITQKASFGFLSARGRHDDFVPLTAYDARMQELQKAKDVPRRFRTINVVDMGRLDRRFRYQRNPMEGVYEMWMTTIQCMKHTAFGGFIVDLKAPGTGIVSAARSDVAVRLGPNGEREGKTRFLRNVGAARSVRLDEGTFGAEFCKFSNAPNASVDGYFYTSPRADVLLDRPGKGAIRQYVDKRFFMQVRGSYEPAELGLGLHTHEARGFFGDIGYGLDPDSN